MAKLEMQNKVLLEAVKQYEVRVAKLEAQNNSLLETVKKSATEQAKTTESWAHVVARTSPQSGATLSPPTSYPSIPNSLNPHGSISQTSETLQTSIVLDLLNTADRVEDFTQLKEKINEALRKYGHTKDARCVGVQRRVGGECQVKL
ncbi:uncharacterized protein Z518_07820 [Rhinocladiella mackenziei CBS 650.93]|uniref:Uncharacterized protein n=1 Tax=Rhinocladiella mackenziei CBS 650.93 TaxID=1442369 RepID=A0A0D2IF40_9EURO|nr:uncharacterized protein Z518_07820 [Rhinocladiella mackenziei CBS 650.93]KIX01881.1 hypothetical protein Z518_07820 [Rhinocladiella mackenziei CBS 650.93]